MCGFFALENIIDKNGESLDLDYIKTQADLIKYRGPDHSNYFKVDNTYLCFHRLAIIDLSDAGNQPFHSKSNLSSNEIYLMCNGEIYNEQSLKSDYLKNHSYQFISTSDCEVLVPMLQESSLEEVCTNLDAEFALCGYDTKAKSLFAARDPMGIRPLFYGYLKENNSIAFCSEAKSLVNICGEVLPFPPGHYYLNGKFSCFHHYQIYKRREGFIKPKIDEVYLTIKNLFEQAVIKRLHADAPMGFLLSGGLDSSLVCAIAAKYLSKDGNNKNNKKIKTFSIGIEDGPIDTKYARIVADYIGSEHYEILFNKEEIFAAIDHIIYSLETFDITTIRASVGMYLLCKKIREQTDLKVLMTGEVSDELFGYKYTDFAPDEMAFQEESIKRVEELYLYDVLRADRCLSAHSFEARVPFSDQAFVNYVMSLDPSLKMNTTGVGKYLLRKSFEASELLPHNILYRDKAAFSDAVGHSMVDYLKEFAEQMFSDQQFEKEKMKYSHATPFTKESLWYRTIFERHFPKRAKDFIKDFWMPNKQWDHCNVKDPSARVLPNYGSSGD